MSPRRDTLDQDEADIRQKILVMGRMIDTSLEQTLRSLLAGDTETARRVLETEQQLNRNELKIQHECALTIATQQPVAKDLRTVMADSRIALDLERVGDHAANIARLVLDGFRVEETGSPAALTEMMELCRKMLAEVLDAYAAQSLEGLESVTADEEQLDGLRAGQVARLLKVVGNTPGLVVNVVELIQIVHRLERVGDHATNIAEQLVYQIKGDRVSFNE